MIWTTSKTKKERQLKIKQLIATNDKAVVRAVIAIYRRQTENERVLGNTVVQNNIGFCGNDAPIMSMYARQIIDHGGLSKEQIKYARTRMIRYSRQLAEIAEQYELKKLAN
jgi:hypothetical protein